ncbi:unnamed protein product, partial [Discosporangium mesarthrocarpum]
RYLYANILGKLMFLAAMTRPDLSHSVRELGRRSTSPCLRHWRGLQHVLRYLPGITDIAIHYPKGTDTDNEQLITGYADSDWANDPETCRRVTGYLLLINGSPIVWRSKLQGAVTLSSSEVKWTTVAHGMRHCIFIPGILAEMGIPQGATAWYGDNRGARQAAAITGFNGRTKHVNI